VLDELVRYADVDVAFEQGFANLNQASIEMLSVSFAWPRRFLKARWSLSVSVSTWWLSGMERLMGPMIPGPILSPEGYWSRICDFI